MITCQNATMLEITCRSSNKPTHETLVLVAYVQKPNFNAYADVSSKVRGPQFDLSVNLYIYIVYARSKFYKDTPCVRACVRACVCACLCACACVRVCADSSEPSWPRG